MNSPLGSIASTITSPTSSARDTVATVSLRVPVRSVHRVTCDQNLLKRAPAHPEHAPLAPWRPR